MSGASGRRDRGDVALHRRVDGRAIARGEQVEQQPAHDRDPEPRLARGPPRAGARAPTSAASGSTQASTIPSSSGSRVRMSLERLHVDLEEQPLRSGSTSGGQVGPEGRGHAVKDVGPGRR